MWGKFLPYKKTELNSISQLLFLWAKSCKIMNQKGELLISTKNLEKQHLLRGYCQSYTIPFILGFWKKQIYA